MLESKSMEGVWVVINNALKKAVLDIRKVDFEKLIVVIKLGTMMSFERGNTCIQMCSH